MVRLAEQPGEEEPQAARRGRDRLAGRVGFEVGRERRGRRVTQLGRLLKALEADQFEFAVHGGVEVARRHRFLFQHEQQRIDRVRGLERRPAGEQFVEDRAERVDVRGRREFLPPRGLLGGHVARRADHRAGAREARRAVDLLGETEVGHFRKQETGNRSRRE